MSTIETVEDFNGLVAEIEATEGYRKPLAWGICRITRGAVDTSKVLLATFPTLNYGCNYGSYAVLHEILGLEHYHETTAMVNPSATVNPNEISCRIDSLSVTKALIAFKPFLESAAGDKHLNVQILKMLGESFPSSLYEGTNPLAELGEFRLVAMFEDQPVTSAEVAYLKLTALSQGLVEIRSLNMNGVFGSLTNVAWTKGQPLELEYLRENEILLKLLNQWPEIDYVDKFPRYLDHVIPADNTRILDSSKVRFGAQLAAGTVVMPGASYINFNAGTTGPVMVEGRISSSAIVGAGSDCGGGCSILGVLSGGNSEPITIGKNTLLGANSVCGISLGDGCILDAGCTILAGTKVFVSAEIIEELREVNLDENMKHLFVSSEVYRGKQLSGLNGLHIRQDSKSGKIIAFRSAREIELNSDLH